jgi:hypothetical protein
VKGDTRESFDGPDRINSYDPGFTEIPVAARTLDEFRGIGPGNRLNSHVLRLALTH